MKIVIFYKAYKKYGGQEKIIYSFTHFLARKGYKVYVYTYNVKDKPEDNNILLKKFFIPNVFNGVRTLLFAIASFLKAKKIKKSDPNVCILGFGKTFYQDIYRSGGGVHAYYFRRATLKYSSTLEKKLYKVKKYLSVSHWINILIEKLTFKSKNLKLIIAPSEFVKRQIVEIFGESIEDKIVIVRNGIDTERFRPSTETKKAMRKKFKINDKEIVFSFVSTNHRLKGLEYLLQAVKIISYKNRDFKLIIAGSGNTSFFKSIINRLNLENRIIYFGKIKEIEKIYQMSDVFVYPTLFDAAASVLLEAMACGNIPIASIYNGTSEIIKEGKNGFLIKNPADFREIAEKMEYILNQRNNLESLKTEAIKSASSHKITDSFSHIETLIKNNC